MVKVSSSDVVAILRRFDLADDEIVPRHIESIVLTHPSATNTLAAFKYKRTQFYVLFDDAAEDDEKFIIDQINDKKGNVSGRLHHNPLEDSLMTFGLPFKGNDVYLYEVISDKKRLDAELASRYPEHSRSTWQKYIQAGHVMVNNEVVTSSRHGVKATDSIAINTPEAEDFSEHSLPIIYLDDSVVVVDKPLGVLTHAKGAISEEFTVADFFSRYVSEADEFDSNRPGIVHRLDRDTSGVIVGARNKETATLLQKQFAGRTAKKVYYAILDGTPKAAKAIIDVPIGRNPNAPSTFRADTKGKSALTRYEVLASNSNGTLVKLEPKTGRTHQLRVHTAYLGTPIKGDRVYGKSSTRLFLHAASLEITIPQSLRKTFYSPIPEEFRQLFPEVSSWELS